MNARDIPKIDVDDTYTLTGKALGATKRQISRRYREFCQERKLAENEGTFAPRHRKRSLPPQDV